MNRTVPNCDCNEGYYEDESEEEECLECKINCETCSDGVSCNFLL